jgi:hypothetical protein
VKKTGKKAKKNGKTSKWKAMYATDTQPGNLAELQ